MHAYVVFWCIQLSFLDSVDTYKADMMDSGLIKEPEKEGSYIIWRKLSFTIFLLGRVEAAVKFKFFPTVRERESEIY